MPTPNETTKTQVDPSLNLIEKLVPSDPNARVDLSQLETLLHQDPTAASKILALMEQVEKVRAYADKRNRMVTLRENAIENYRKQEMEVFERQESCPHRKANGPSISGQRDHSGNLILICTRCQKTWTGKPGANGKTDSPDPYLLSQMNHVLIGGPVIGG